MIEISLVPDVKQELIKARRLRNTIVIFSIITALGAIGITAALGLFIGGQALLSNSKSKTIDEKYEELLSKDSNINVTLSVQNQLLKIQELGTNRIVSSRVFGIFAAALSEKINDDLLSSYVKISDSSYDAATQLVKFSGQINSRKDRPNVNVYSVVYALERVIKDTHYIYIDPVCDKNDDLQPPNYEKSRYNSSITCTDDLSKVDSNTIYTYTKEPQKLVSGPVNISGLSLGSGEGGGTILKFEIDFILDPAALKYDPVAGNWSLKPPSAKNVTDSNIQIPDGIFGSRTPIPVKEDKK